MAYNFQGANDTIVLGNNVLPSFSTYSFVAWINTDVADNSQRQIISLNDAGSGNRDMWLEFTNAGTNVMAFGYFDTGGSFPQVSWTTGFTAGTWHFVAGVYNGTTQAIFADTDPVAKATNTPGNPPNTGTADGFIGNRTGGGRPANGFIAEVAFYNRDLSGAECAAMGSGLSPLFSSSGLINYYSLVKNPVDYRGGQNGAPSGAVTIEHPKGFIYPFHDRGANISSSIPKIIRRNFDSRSKPLAFP